MSGKRGKAGEGRLGFIDDARGLAVVLMIFWHTVDGWIRLDLREANPRISEVMLLFGGTAAPMFVTLAGVGAAMKLVGDHARGRPKWVTVRELAFRGLHVVATGYALRVYAWLVDGQGLARPETIPAWIPVILGLGTTLVGLERAGDGKREGIPLTLFGIAVYAFGISRVYVIEPWKYPGLLKVDVLQAIGACLTIIALLDPLLGLARRPYLGIVVGMLLVLPTDTIAASLPGRLPIPVASYLGQWNDPIARSLAAFPIFPWIGYALAGTTIGAIWLRASDADRADRIVFGVSAFACLVATLAYGPHVHLGPLHDFIVAHVPYVTRALFILYRLGFGLALVVIVHLFCRLTGLTPLRELGKTSMVIYWVHLEFAYGIAAKPLKHRLDYLGWTVGFVVLTVAMALVARLRLRAPTWLAERRAARSAASAGSS